MNTKQIIAILKKAKEEALSNQKIIKEIEEQISKSREVIQENCDLLRFMDLKDIRTRYYCGDIIIDATGLEIKIGTDTNNNSILVSIHWDNGGIFPHDCTIGELSTIGQILPLIKKTISLLSEEGEEWE